MTTEELNSIISKLVNLFDKHPGETLEYEHILFATGLTDMESYKLFMDLTNNYSQQCRMFGIVFMTGGKNYDSDTRIHLYYLPFKITLIINFSRGYLNRYSGL